jgi:hypothetical protein
MNANITMKLPMICPTLCSAFKSSSVLYKEILAHDLQRSIGGIKEYCHETIVLPVIFLIFIPNFSAKLSNFSFAFPVI